MKWNLLAVFCLTSVTFVSAEEQTAFLEPLKNITAIPGTNLEFSCSILHLENARVIWFWRGKDATMDSILAVNGLKVTRNPKISFSLIPRSGDVMESILYIFNVGEEEGGTYICGVNTEPMILQRGTLEVKEKETDEAMNTILTRSMPSPTTTTTEAPPAADQTSEEADSSEIFCINIPKIWKETKSETEKFAKDVWKKVTSLF